MPAYFFRSEPGAAELRRLARRESGRVCQRGLMIANLLEGMEREEAARLAGLSRSAAYEWHNRYEVDGIEGCATGRSSLRHGLWIQCHDAPAAYDTEADTVSRGEGRVYELR